MERYAIIHEKFPREFILLQGTGCRWGKCEFCDYHNDIGENPFEINKTVLSRVTGQYGVLDVINSGSAIELDDDTIELIKNVAIEKSIHTLWFEMHYMYRYHLGNFAKRFAPILVKFRCGVESFDGEMREKWKKGIAKDVSEKEVAEFFDGVCLLCGTEGDSKQRILNDISLAKANFEYASVNLFNENSTAIKADKKLQKWFIENVYQNLKDDSQIEVLINNTDLGVG